MFIQNCFFFFLWKQINGKNELFLQKKRNPILSHFRNENRIVCSISISNRFRSCSAAIRQKSIFSIYFHDHCSLNAISSTIKEGKGRKIVADVLLRTSSLFLSRQMLIRVFLFVSLFFSFLCSFFIVTLIVTIATLIPTWIETVFFFYYYFVRETRDYFGSSVSNWYFQWFFTENGGISSLYISSSGEKTDENF